MMERFWSKVEKTDGCWIWTGARRNGYGAFLITNQGRKRVVYAHRLSFELVHGAIPKGLYVLHHCDNPVCVNPIHLFLGTQSDNLKDAGAKGRMARVGESNPFSKLTWPQVESMRDLAKNLSTRKLASIFGIDHGHVARILRGERWNPLSVKRGLGPICFHKPR